MVVNKYKLVAISLWCFHLYHNWFQTRVIFFISYILFFGARWFESKFRLYLDLVQNFPCWLQQTASLADVDKPCIISDQPFTISVWHLCKTSRTFFSRWILLSRNDTKLLKPLWKSNAGREFHQSSKFLKSTIQLYTQPATLNSLNSQSSSTSILSILITEETSNEFYFRPARVVMLDWKKNKPKRHQRAAALMDSFKHWHGICRW